MKKILVLNAVLLAMLVGCKKAETPVADTEPEEEFYEKDALTTECYQGILKKDTIDLKLITLGNEVKLSDLSYRFFEKDKSKGRAWGEIHGDTIFLTYSFMSEAKMSHREVAFLKKGNTLTEGYGDIVTDSVGKVKFKDRKKLSFDSKVVLTKTACK